MKKQELSIDCIEICLLSVLSGDKVYMSGKYLKEKLTAGWKQLTLQRNVSTVIYMMYMTSLMME